MVDTTGEEMSIYTTKSIRANANASTMKKTIDPFFESVWGADTTVTLTQYDATGAEVDENGTSHLYTIKLNKLIDGYSTSGVMANPGADKTMKTEKTEAKIMITPPTRAQ